MPLPFPKRLRGWLFVAVVVLAALALWLARIPMARLPVPDTGTVWAVDAAATRGRITAVPGWASQRYPELENYRNFVTRSTQDLVLILRPDGTAWLATRHSGRNWLWERQRDGGYSLRPEQRLKGLPGLVLGAGAFPQGQLFRRTGVRQAVLRYSLEYSEDVPRTGEIVLRPAR